MDNERYINTVSIVRELIGPAIPTGNKSFDAKIYENLKIMADLIEELQKDYDIAQDAICDIIKKEWIDDMFKCR